MTDLSHVTEAIWKAFNEDKSGMFVDYGDKLAAALRALADQVVLAHGSRRNNEIRAEILAIAAELEGGNG